MRWVGPILMCVCTLVGTAHAQPATSPTVYGAMPSGVHVARAETLGKGVAVVEVLSGLGYRSGLLGADHSLVRALADVAAAFGVTADLSLGVSLDGYYDRHSGFPTGPSSGCGDTCEQGYVGAPHVHARYVRHLGAAALGAQLGVWIPGDQLPSMKLGATSLELRGLASLDVGPGRLSLEAGFRLDNTANTSDNLGSFTVPDRVSYGSSNYHALVAGAHYAIAATPRVWVAAESSVARFLGAAPSNAAELEDGRWLARLGASAGFSLASQWTLVAFIDAVKSPGVLGVQVMALHIPLIPYEPMITAGLALQARFGGSPPARPISTIAVAPPPPPQQCWDTGTCKAEEQPLLTEVSGTVIDDAGKPIAGATVTVTSKASGATATATTNADGTYVIADLKIGRRTITPAKGGPTTVDTVEETALELRIAADGRDPIVSTLAPTAGKSAVPAVTLQPTLPAGQLKGIVRTLRGKPIPNAVITVPAANATTVSGPDGTFSIDLAPGKYRVTVKAPGYTAQDLDVVIDPNGVALKEFILAN